MSTSPANTMRAACPTARSSSFASPRARAGRASAVWRLFAALAPLAPFALVATAIVQPALAQSAGEIFVATSNAEIRVGQELVGRLLPGERAVVQDVRGDWLAVKHRTPGWVAAKDLLPEEQALEFFSARLQKDPHDATALLARARYWKELSEQRRNQAISEWNETLRLDSTQGVAHYRRAQLWRAKQVPARAIADLEAAIKLLPFHDAAYRELAELYLERGEYARAIANYAHVLRLRPWEAPPHIERGWAYFLSGDLASAMFDFQIAQRLDPHNALLAYRIGLIHAQELKLAQAKVDFDRAIELNPRLAEAYFARAPLHRLDEKEWNDWDRKKELDRLALQDYTKALHFNPQFAEAYTARAKLWVNQGEFDRALADLSRLVTTNPRQAPAYFERGKIYLERGQGELALADFHRSAEIEPELKQRESDIFVRALRQRAEQRFKAKQFDLAVADYSEAISITPEDWSLLAARAEVYLSQKDYSRAIADLSKVAGNRSEDPAAWFSLAHAWYLAGQYGRAAVEYRKAILVEPNFVPAYTNLAWLLATCPEKQFRNGKQAVKYATYASEMTGYKQYAILDTLAAAQAEAGDFHEAIKIQSAVVYMAPPEQRREFRDRLNLYGGLKPYRETRAENAGINADSDTAGVLATSSDGNSAAEFAKSLEMALPELEALAAENAAAAEAAEAAKTAAKTVASTTAPDTNASETNAPATTDAPLASAENEPVAVKTLPAAAPAKETPLKKDDPAAVSALKKLGGKTSLRLTGELQSIGLQYTKFTDQEATLLDGVPNLEIIDLTFTSIGEPTFKKLGAMKPLKLIVLDQTKVTNELLANLAELPNLEVISVKATTISGAGLMRLKNLPKLNMVLINGTRVTSAELQELQAAMPNVKFVR